MAARAIHRRLGRSAVVAALWTCAGPEGSAAQLAPVPTRAPLAVWDVTARLTAGGGYRDNVLLTSVAPENSAFVAAAADVSFMRLSERGSQWTFFLLGEDTRYFDSPSVPKEQVFSGTAQVQEPVGPRDRIGGLLQYLYQNQILDVSETEADLRRVLVEGHDILFRPHWQHSLGRGWAVTLEGTLNRQFYAADLDDYWEGAGRLSLARRYARHAEVSVGYQSRHRFYDTRSQYDSQGILRPDTSLVYWQHEVAGQWRHYWDAPRHWRTVTRAGLLLNRDNGSGYFDYDRLQVSQQVRWSHLGWEVTGQARMGWYRYAVQRIGNEHRDRAYYALHLRLERRLGRHWLLYAAAEREWSVSNDPLDEYDDWIATAGMGVEFESP
ncbi:MAG: hypothetical protein JXQ71_05925 [Verrucomicrobia bacterium]|nr:hypothetical protein [Verrucomicrobiota bacterium]